MPLIAQINMDKIVFLHEQGDSQRVVHHRVGLFWPGVQCVKSNTLPVQ